MAEYLNSNLVRVYPSGYRDHVIDLEASRTTEESVTKAMKALLYTSTKSFLQEEADNSLTIVIDGYVFSISNGKANISALFPNATSDTEIFAYINKEDIGGINMLVGGNGDSVLDREGKFEGLSFSDT